MTTSWLEIAKSLIGVKEVPGPASSPTIMAWAKKLGAKVLGIVYPNDATPWCGLFAAYCVDAVGLPPPKIAVRASAWSAWGAACTPCVGAVLVFTREGGGHVGFYFAEDKEAFHVLGGNQGDAVSITRIAKSRLAACRWPAYVPVTTGRRIVAVPGGKTLSRNEA